ncbi:hypothetical protein ACFE04_028496 [Oxalis oulophora]
MHHQLETDVEKLSKFLEEPFDQYTDDKVTEIRMQVINLMVQYMDVIVFQGQVAQRKVNVLLGNILEKDGYGGGGGSQVADQSSSTSKQREEENLGIQNSNLACEGLQGRSRDVRCDGDRAGKGEKIFHVLGDSLDKELTVDATLADRCVLGGPGSVDAEKDLGKGSLGQKRPLSPYRKEIVICNSSPRNEIEAMVDSGSIAGRTRNRNLKKEARRRGNNDVEAGIFKDCVSKCGLADVPFVGPPFTWNNRRKGEGFIQARLDRVLANKGWAELFSQAVVLHHSDYVSDHLPLIIHSKGLEERCRSRRFRFENSWNSLEGCSRAVSEAWVLRHEGSMGLMGCWNKLASCRANLSVWRKNHPSNFGGLIATKIKSLESLKLQPSRVSVSNRISSLQSELSSSLYTHCLICE